MLVDLSDINVQLWHLFSAVSMTLAPAIIALHLCRGPVLPLQSELRRSGSTTELVPVALVDS